MNSFIQLLRMSLYMKVFQTKFYVLNNTSCDMDSFISSYVLSFCKNIQENIMTYDSQSTKLPKEIKFNEKSENIYIPLMNCKKGELKSRLDVAFLMKTFKINEDLLFYFHDDEVKQDLSSGCYENTKLILVDHHVLDSSQSGLSHLVDEIYDHHSETSYPVQYTNLTKKTLKYPLGSCSTLILSDFLLSGQVFTEDPLFFISAILQDTENFRPDFYRNRWTNLDYFAYDQICKYHSISPQEALNYYSKLEQSKFDLEANLSLGIEALMRKDNKNFTWGKFSVTWSGLQVPIASLAKAYGWEELKKYFDSICMFGINYYIMQSLSLIDKSTTMVVIYDSNSLFLDDMNGIFAKLENFLKEKLGVRFIEMKKKKSCPSMIKIIVDRTITRKNFEPILKSFFELI